MKALVFWGFVILVGAIILHLLGWLEFPWANVPVSFQHPQPVYIVGGNTNNPVATSTTAAPTSAAPANPAPTSPSQPITSLPSGFNCSGCSGRIEGLMEANGVMNPNGFHVKSGNPVSMDVPAGWGGQVWDCFSTKQVTGPAHLSQVCEATFRN